MKTLSTRELQLNIGKLEPSDSPIFITKYKKELFILLSIPEYEGLLKKAAYDGHKWYTKWSMAWDYVKKKWGFDLNKLDDMEDEYISAYDGDVPKPSKSPAMAKALEDIEKMKINN